MPPRKPVPKPIENVHGFSPRGLALWRQFTDVFDLEPSSEEILLAACRCADLTDMLDRVTLERGPLGDDGRVASWVTECRFQKGILLKLTAQLERLSAPAAGTSRNLGGARAPYGQRRS